MRQEAIALGQVVDADAVKAIDNMNDSFAAVYATVKGLTGAILGELAGPISQIAQDLLGVIRQAGPQQIAQQVAQGLLDFIKLAGNAFFKLAEFIEAFIKKFAPILGLDIRSEAEKELEALRNKEAGTTRTVSIGGRPVLQFTPGSLTPEESARRGDLERQVAAEASGSVLQQFQANFNAAIDTATQSLQQKMEQSAASTAPNAAEEKQVTLLEQINRNGQIGTVEILN
jgi:flagellar biosynthesis/type III secretory pathway protein FliH